MHTVLLLFNNVPNLFRIIKFENPSPEIVALLRSCHNCLLNSSEEENYTEEARKLLSDIASAEDNQFPYDGQLVFDDTAYDGEIDLLPICDGRTEVIYAGFID